MCGIAGIFVRPDVSAVRRMTHALVHRGPDDAGCFSDHMVALGHRRLSIVDPTPSGHQPMVSDCGDVVIVYNGELYNFREERTRLEGRGHAFKSDSDTEVILKLYLDMGERLLDRLNGIFAFAIYDRRKGAGRERLVLARDPFGIKPLVFSRRNGRLVFASELKGLVASGLVSAQIDPEGLRTLINFGAVHQPRTLLAEAEMLPSGHLLVAESGQIRLKRYWSLGTDRHPELRKARYEDQVDVVATALEASVRRQLVADVPVGAFLSGGVDSSLIVALMSREMGRRVKTFSVGFREGPEGHDESADALEMADYLGTDHRQVMVDGSKAADELIDFVRGLDQPSLDGLNSYFVSQAAASKVKVSLSGTGSDELLAGYPWFAGMAEGDWQTAGLGRRARLALFLNPAARRRRASSVREQFLDAYGRQYHCFGPDGPPDLISPDIATDEDGPAARMVPLSADLVQCDELSGAPVLDRVSAICLNAYTRNQLLRDIDACSMAHSLEVRVPYLDIEIADIALSLPQQAKLTPGGEPLDPLASYERSGVKRVMVDAARRYLPDDFFTKRGKRGFGLPFDAWLRGPLRPFLEDALSEQAVKSRGFFRSASVDRVKRDFLAGKRPWNQPWLLMVVDLWAKHLAAVAADASTSRDERLDCAPNEAMVDAAPNYAPVARPG